jgi:superfamily II DNA/RNA helicase
MMVALDEMHVGQQWSVFRHKYSELHQFRYRIGTSIPWFGTSATLDPRTLAVSKDAAGFVDPVILRTTIDRPEILYEVREFEVGQKTYEDLRFLIPDKTTFEEAKKLPKVIVYMDTTLEIREAVAKIRASYVQAGLLEWEANRLTCAYFSRMGKRQKKKIAEDFQKEDSTVRIIIATDALGMGVSNRRVELVIQWGVKRIVDDDSAVKTIMQRLGRVARETGEIGHFIWFVPSWVKGIPVIVEATDTSAGSKKTRKPPWTKTDEKNYASMTPFFRELLNPRNCFREILLGFFCEPLRDNTTYPRYPYCCNHLTCQPTYGWESRQSKSPSQRRQEMQEILENFNKQVGVEEDIARKEKILFKLPRNPASAPHGWPHLKGLFQEQLGEWAERKARIRFGKSQYFKPSPQLTRL